MAKKDELSSLKVARTTADESGWLVWSWENEWLLQQGEGEGLGSGADVTQPMLGRTRSRNLQ